MNSYVQVARTYWTRPRFWIFSVCYLAMTWWWIAGVDPSIQVLASVNMASIIGCFVALHVRRQFASDTARLVPGFALPHVILGLLAGLTLWLFIPAAQIALGYWPPGALAFHAAVGLLLAAVVCWPRAIVLLAAAPVLFVYAINMVSARGSFLGRLMAGQEVWLGHSLLAAAAIAQAGVILVLLRLSDRSGATDELAVEPEVTSQPVGRWREWSLERRDAVVERALVRTRRWGWSALRWRVPMAVSWSQLALPVVVVLAALCSAPLLPAAHTWVELSLATMFITTSVIMVAPFGPWHPRRLWLGRELMLPLTREQFFRQLAGALAFDVCLWTTLACALSAMVLYCASWADDGGRSPGLSTFAGHAVTLLGIAVLLYGLALVTFGLRYWIPLIVVLGGAWAWIVWGAILSYALDRRVDPGLNAVYLFALTSAGVGSLLVFAARRRWLAMDLT